MGWYLFEGLSGGRRAEHLIGGNLTRSHKKLEGSELGTQRKTAVTGGAAFMSCFEVVMPPRSSPQQLALTRILELKVCLAV